MKNEGKNKIVVLLGPNLNHLKTLSLLLEEDVNVVGVCIANKKTFGLNFQYIKKAIRKRGILKFFTQALERIVYKMLNSKKDKTIFNELYNETEIKKSIRDWGGSIYKTDDYQNEDTFSWIKQQNPDIIVIHTPYWVGKKIRDLVKGNVLGGHPGITPYYRGVHSAFWAVYNEEAEKIGYSVFWVDSGVDTGDVIIQKTIELEKGDSYFTLGWKGMIETGKQQALAIKKLDQGVPVPRIKHKFIPENSNYSHPTIFQYIKYRFKQNRIR